MNADELFEVVAGGTDVLRVETLDAYDSESDHDYLDRFLTGAPKPDPAAKATWLALISAARDRGRPWRRLRVIRRPVADYVRYACEWGYTDNTDAGEDIRVLDEASWPDRVAQHCRFGDLYIVDGELLAMQYDAAGRFIAATPASTGDISTGSVADVVSRVTTSFSLAADFADWWGQHPELHRDLTAV